MESNLWVSGIEYKELIWMSIVILVGVVYGILGGTYGKKKKSDS
jgi:hypothetical protein